MGNNKEVHSIIYLLKILCGCGDATCRVGSEIGQYGARIAAIVMAVSIKRGIGEFLLVGITLVSVPGVVTAIPN